jgi:hypothetical protein
MGLDSKPTYHHKTLKLDSYLGLVVCEPYLAQFLDSNYLDGQAFCHSGSVEPIILAL